MRLSTAFLSLLTAGALLVVLTGVDGYLRVSAREQSVSAVAGTVRKLGLTDLALFTEARYTRHLSQSDLHSAFQDHPMAFEHFPSGSLVAPPWDSDR